MSNKNQSPIVGQSQTIAPSVGVADNSNADEIRAFLKDNQSFRKGECVIANISETSNDDYKRLMIVQEFKTLRGSISGFNGSLKRTWIPVQSDAIEANGFKVGGSIDDFSKKEFGEGAKIVTQYKNTPWYTREDGSEQDPVTDRNGELLTVNGEPQYSITRIALKSEEQPKMDWDQYKA